MNNPRALEIRYLRIDAPAEDADQDFNPKKYLESRFTKDAPLPIRSGILFAKRLHSELVPIGIIDTSWGGNLSRASFREANSRKMRF